MHSFEPALAHIISLSRSGQVVVAIVGSREFGDLSLVHSFVAALPASCVVVSGGARGADQCAARAWRVRGFEPVVLPFKRELGAAGGPARNTELVRSLPYGSVLVAFRAAGQSRGTDDVVRKAKAAPGVSVFVIQEQPASGPTQLSLF